MSSSKFMYVMVTVGAVYDRAFSLILAKTRGHRPRLQCLHMFSFAVLEVSTYRFCRPRSLEARRETRSCAEPCNRPACLCSRKEDPPPSLSAHSSRQRRRRGFRRGTSPSCRRLLLRACPDGC